ncbi:MAG: hypothetical protein LAQ69_19355 [Acidobacteriia bacterium]|nr:hypothetical protein [Terriglobia bacterium]
MLFDVVDGMEECASINPHLAATESPVCTQDEVKSKHLVIEIIQHPPAHEAEVGHVFLPLSGVGSPAIAATAKLQRHRAGMRPIGGAFPKTVQAGTKSGPEYAIAGHFSSGTDKSCAVSMTVKARDSGNANCARSIPLHFGECPPGSRLKGQRHLF